MTSSTENLAPTWELKVPWRIPLEELAGSEMLRTSLGTLVAVSIIALCPAPGLADERCHQLEALHAQYAGVQLTPEQQQLKRKLVAWYHGHCTRHHVADKD